MITDVIDGLLSQLDDVPYYYLGAEFAEGQEDGLCVIYSFYDIPGLFGDGEEKTTDYRITFKIYGTSFAQVYALQDELAGILKNAGLIRRGTTYSGDDDFPQYYVHIMDYSYIERSE